MMPGPSPKLVRMQAELDTCYTTIERQKDNIGKLMYDRRKLKARVEKLEKENAKLKMRK